MMGWSGREGWGGPGGKGGGWSGRERWGGPGVRGGVVRAGRVG